MEISEKAAFIKEYLQIFHILFFSVLYDTIDVSREVEGHVMFGYVKVYQPELKMGNSSTTAASIVRCANSSASGTVFWPV